MNAIFSFIFALLVAVSGSGLSAYNSGYDYDSDFGEYDFSEYEEKVMECAPSEKAGYKVLVDEVYGYEMTIPESWTVTYDNYYEGSYYLAIEEEPNLSFNIYALEYDELLYQDYFVDSESFRFDDGGEGYFEAFEGFSRYFERLSENDEIILTFCASDYSFGEESALEANKEAIEEAARSMKFTSGAMDRVSNAA